MKLLRNEAILGVVTILFIIISLFISISTNESAVTVENPEFTATPYFININTATKDELDLLDGIGPSLADKIIKHRESNGPFESADDLAEVSGIGSATVENIRDYIEI